MYLQKTLKQSSPFIKWAGGKRRLLSTLMEKVPIEMEYYYEPFIGGGALFFHMQPLQSTLSDINHLLIHTYQTVKKKPHELIKQLEKHTKLHCNEYYQIQRKNLTNSSNPIHIASIFIYLNKTCFNGLFRVNQKGDFNVPMGKYNKPNICDASRILSVSSTLQDTKIQCHSFEQTPIKKNTFYYLDPPYHTTYSNYSKDGFGEQMHANLSDFCHMIHKSGSYFMLSNSNTPLIQKLYSQYSIEEVLAPRTISCNGNQRNSTTELLICNY